MKQNRSDVMLGRFLFQYTILFMPSSPPRSVATILRGGDDVCVLLCHRDNTEYFLHSERTSAAISSPTAGAMTTSAFSALCSFAAK